MLYQLLRGNIDFFSIVAQILAVLLIIFLILPLHEWAHAFTASLLGDKSIKYRGRLSLNPLSHIDPLGALCMFLVGFGWAKPVPVNSRNLKKPKRDMVLVSIAGPLSNILLAFLGLLFLRIFGRLVMPLLLTSSLNPFWGQLISTTYMFFSLFCTLNASLAVFNLLPIPPLDGSHLMAMILPARIYFKYVKYERYISFALVLLLVFDILSIPLFYLSTLLLSGLEWIVGLIPFL